MAKKKAAAKKATAKRRPTKKRSAKKKPTPKQAPPADDISAEISREHGDVANGRTVDTEPGSPGRPANSPNRDYDQVEAPVSRCRKCDSTNREAYFGRPQIRNFETVQRRPGGSKFNRLIRRRTKCSDCGQYRFDLSYEFDPAAVETETVPAFIGAAGNE